MGTTISCQKARMGNTEFFIGKMKAGILIDTVGFAEEIPDWNDMSIEEKMQRELDEKRVTSEISPYLTDDPEHFFGSLIIDVYRGWDKIHFEPLVNMVKGLPEAYKDQVTDIGFLTLPDNRSLIALDGQHRLLALNVAIKGWRGLRGGSKLSEEDKNKLIPHPDLRDDDISFILVYHEDSRKIRKIFNKVNRYAKQTSRGDNIITSEDDENAIIARKLLRFGEPLGTVNNQHVVNWKSNTLSKNSIQLTTISAVYTFAQELLKEEETPSYKKVFQFKGNIDKKYEFISKIWEELISGLDAYAHYIEIVESDVNVGKRVGELREKNLLFKPVTQMALAIAIRSALLKGLSINEVIEKINKIGWNYDNPVWEQILIYRNNRILAGKETIKDVGKLVGYLVAGNKYSQTERNEVLDMLRNKTGDATRLLPSPV